MSDGPYKEQGYYNSKSRKGNDRTKGLIGPPSIFHLVLAFLVDHECILLCLDQADILCVN